MIFMADFKKAHEITAKVEGGYANNKADTGGRTYKGIAQNKQPQWKGWPIVMEIVGRVGENAAAINAEAAKNPTLQNLVLDFYKTSQWDVLNLDKISDQRVANELYDTAVNMGINTAGRFLQQALNVCNRNGTLYPDLTVDGVIGSKTIDCFNALSLNDKYMVWKLLNCQQGARYIEICKSNPSQEVFMRSWASRVFEAAL